MEPEMGSADQSSCWFWRKICPSYWHQRKVSCPSGRVPEKVSVGRA